MQKIIYICLLTFLTFSLNGCPLPQTNMNISDQETHDYHLPYLPSSKKAVVYLVQPYFYVDWYMVAGTTSEGFHYQGSRVYIKDQQNHKRYIGLLNNRNNLCFYAPEGRYEFIFENEGAIPQQYNSSLKLINNTIQYFAVQSKSLSYTTPQLTFALLPPENGKYFIKNKPPEKCFDLQNYSENSQIPVILKTILYNKTSYTLQVRNEDGSTFYKKLLPNERYTHISRLSQFNDQRSVMTGTTFRLDNEADHSSKIPNRNYVDLLIMFSQQFNEARTHSYYVEYLQKTPIKGESHCHIMRQPSDMTIECIVDLKETKEYQHYDTTPLVSKI